MKREWPETILEESTSTIHNISYREHPKRDRHTVVSSRDDKTPLVALFGQACIIRKKLVDDT